MDLKPAMENVHPVKMLLFLKIIFIYLVFYMTCQVKVLF